MCLRIGACSDAALRYNSGRCDFLVTRRCRFRTDEGVYADGRRTERRRTRMKSTEVRASLLGLAVCSELFVQPERAGRMGRVAR